MTDWNIYHEVEREAREDHRRFMSEYDPVLDSDYSPGDGDVDPPVEADE